MSESIGVSLIGCGVVGTEVVRALVEDAARLEARSGRRIALRHIVVGNVDKDRDPVVDRALLTADIDAALADPDVQLVVELVGGVDDAFAWLKRAIEAGKHVVTANKALIAERGPELLALAEARGVDVHFEAAVAGAIPILRVLRESFAAERVESLLGIVNGTSNYILSRMSEGGVEFADALREAQEKGYAEADPTLDVGGGDAAHKLAILAAIAFSVDVPDEAVLTEGIDTVGAADIALAKGFGYAIKPLAVARREGECLDLRVHPALVPESYTLAKINGATNAVCVRGALGGDALLSGPGAGGAPTALSVLGDIIDVTRNVACAGQRRNAARGVPVSAAKPAQVKPTEERRSRFYLRLDVQDQAGALSEITSRLAERDVSISEVHQGGHADAEAATVALLTHDAGEAALRDALSSLQGSGALAADPVVLRVLA